MKEELVSSKGNSLAQHIGAVKYIECSAQTQLNINSLFEEAVRAVLQPAQKFKKAKGRSSIFDRKGSLSYCDVTGEQIQTGDLSNEMTSEIIENETIRLAKLPWSGIKVEKVSFFQTYSDVE